jgi:hypothetical protein
MFSRRFLRARRFVPAEAFKQFKTTEDWRKDQGIDDLFLRIETEEFEETRRLVTISLIAKEASLTVTS